MVSQVVLEPYTRGPLSWLFAVRYLVVACAFLEEQNLDVMGLAARRQGFDVDADFGWMYQALSLSRILAFHSCQICSQVMRRWTNRLVNLVGDWIANSAVG